MDNYRQRVYQYYITSLEQTYAVDRASLRYAEPYHRHIIRRHFPAERKARILDVGCGPGAMLHFCRLEGYDRVRGVDGSPQQVAKARELGIEGVEEGDLLATLQSLPDACQDVVIAFNILEHFTKDELLPLIDEVRRVLSPGGRWIIHVPNGESPFAGRIRYGDFTHENSFTRNSLGQILLASGFNAVNSFEDVIVVHSLKSFVRRVLWSVIRAALLLYIATETGSFERETILTQNFLTVAIR